MKNTSSLAIITVGDLNPAQFTQDTNGLISLNYDWDVESSSDRVVRYTNVDAGTQTATLEVYDASANAVEFEIPLSVKYSAQGKYLGCFFNLGLPPLQS